MTGALRMEGEIEPGVAVERNLITATKHSWYDEVALLATRKPGS